MSQLRLTNDQKLRIIKHKEDHPSLTQTELGNWMKEAFGLPKPMTQASISKIISKRKELEAMSPSKLSAKRPRSFNILPWKKQWSSVFCSASIVELPSPET
uniref:ARS-binding protein 1 N-terminal domain-containing protein n=1 Tax=Peronospora matthiolae TaxID=2874970 RepID=A0AAV1U842_9STRA